MALVLGSAVCASMDEGFCFEGDLAGSRRSFIFLKNKQYSGRC